MQANFYHLMEYNLGFLLALLFYLFAISSKHPLYRLLILILLPPFYFVAGGFVLPFLGIFLCHLLYIERGRSNYIFSQRIA